MRLRKETEGQDALKNEEVELVASVSCSLGHPLRVALFRYIYKENMLGHRVCIKDLLQVFDYSQSTISEHIQKLKASGLLDLKKEKSYSYYYVNLGILGKYLECVRKLNR